MLGVILAVLGLGIAGAVGYVANIAARRALDRQAQAPRPGRAPRSSTPPTARSSASSSRTSSARRSPATTIPQIVKDATVAIEDERFYEHKGVDSEARRPRGAEEHRVRQDGGGRLDADDAARPHALHHQGADVQAQGPRGQARRAAREHPRQGAGSSTSTSTASRTGRRAGRPRWASRPPRARSSTSPRRELELHEAALLAGLPQAPSQYNPFNNPEAALRRRNQVLDKMAELRMISFSEAAEAQGARRSASSAPLLHRAARELLLRLRPPGAHRQVRHRARPPRRAADLHDDRPRRCSRRRARRSARSSTFPNAPKSAIVTIDPKNGHILAMASSAKYAETKFNLAAQGKRQPGSTFKIMGLMAALDRGVVAREHVLRLQAPELHRPEVRADRRQDVQRLVRRRA